MFKASISVDQDHKNGLILKKEIRQSTAKILQRPSEFQPSKPGVEVSPKNPVSPQILEALILQKKQNQLGESVLSKWVDKYQANKKETEMGEKIPERDEIERQFEKLHQEMMVDSASYATQKFDACVPSSGHLLNSSAAKDKCRVARHRSFRTPSSQEDVKSSKTCSAPKTGTKYQGTNIARDMNNLSKKPNKDSPLKEDQKQPQSKKKESESEKRGDIIQSKFFQAYKQKRSSGKQQKEDKVKNSNKQGDIGFELGMETNIMVHNGVHQPTHQQSFKVLKPASGPREAVQKNPPRSKVEENVYEEIDSVYVPKPPRKVKSPRPDYDYAKNPFGDESSYEIVENSSTLPRAGSEDDFEGVPRNKKIYSGPTAPFERFQNCLFNLFTACVPWAIMKKFYWKKDDQSEEIFTITRRRNSRMRHRPKDF